jgi:putative heme-binding domain-containing protein
MLLDMLKAPEDFTRLHAKRELKRYGAHKVLPLLAEWVAKLDPKEADYDHHRLEALWTYQHFDQLDDALLESLLTNGDHKVRAAAVRALSISQAKATNVMGRLERAVEDKHPRVRLEAVRALAVIPGTRSAELAATALDQPLDEWLDFGLWQAFRDLEPQWLPALKEGKLDFGGKVDRLTFALKAVEAPGMVAPLMTLLRERKVPADRLEGVLTLIATLGGPQDMGTILDIALADMSPEKTARQRALIDALVSASQSRKTAPTGDLARLGALLDSPDEQLRISTARALGVWKVAQFRPAFIALASRKNNESDVLHQAGIDALAALGDAEAVAALKQFAGSATRTIADRTRAINALAAHDTPAAAGYAAAVLADSKETDDPSALILAIAERKAGPPALIESLASQRLKPDVAKRAVRAVNESLRPLPELSAALRKAGGLTEGGTKLSAEEFAAVLKEVAETGNAARGEVVYRRKDLACVRCHAIAGAGGRVGPDLVSIGASAPVDYLLDSVLNPNSKIKEGYHSKILELADGRVLTGIIVRETPKEVVIRDATDAEVTLQPAAIEVRSDGRSLMPDGVIDALTRSELVDLIRFLSELGKVGAFATGKERVVRRWQSLVWTQAAHQRLNRTSFDSAASSDPEFTWEPAYSTVGGELPLDGLAKFIPHRDVTPPTSFLRFEIEATAAGPIELKLNSTAGLTAWLDGKPAQAATSWKLDLAQGRHTVTLAINRDARPAPLRIELADVPGSPARAELVTGK